MRSIDLNCDMGESFGVYTIGNDEAIMTSISSANIACGFHAGDPLVMKKTVELAVKNQVGIGAHLGLPDLQGFGRREMGISAEEAYALALYQIGAMQGITKNVGGHVRHVKAHGALYNMAAKRQDLAEAIVQACKTVDPALIIVGLANSEWVVAAHKYQMNIAQEVFADRNYEEDGSLTPRHHADALIHDQDVAVQHVVRMVKEGVVKTRTGKEVAIQADTICIHGDGKYAVEFAKAIRHRLNQEGIEIQQMRGVFE